MLYVSFGFVVPCRENRLILEVKIYAKISPEIGAGSRAKLLLSASTMRNICYLLDVYCPKFARGFAP